MNQSTESSVLLVDDQPAKLLTYQVILSQLDVRLVTASSAREALENLLKGDFAVVLIDVCMPELDGFELAALIRENGVYDYSIFLDEETNTLFAVQKVRGKSGSQSLGKNPIVKKWWSYMADIMETNPDDSPVSIPLKEVFYLE